jgi:hypothetical protein
MELDLDAIEVLLRGGFDISRSEVWALTRRLREQDAEIAELRKTCEHVLRFLPVLCGRSQMRDGVEGRLRAALESKGGES